MDRIQVVKYEKSKYDSSEFYVVSDLFLKRGDYHMDDISWGASWIPKNATVLDISFQHGRFISYLKQTHHMDQLDANTDKCLLSLSAIDIDTQDICNLTIKDQCFDVVSMFGVIEFLSIPQKTLALVKSVLSKQGKLILSVTNATHLSVISSLFFDYSKILKEQTSQTRRHFFNKKSLIGLLESSGFWIECISCVDDDTQANKYQENLNRPNQEVTAKLTQKENSLSSQFVVCARPMSESTTGSQLFDLVSSKQQINALEQEIKLLHSIISEQKEDLAKIKTELIKCAEDKKEIEEHCILEKKRSALLPSVFQELSALKKTLEDNRLLLNEFKSKNDALALDNQKMKKILSSRSVKKILKIQQQFDKLKNKLSRIIHEQHQSI